MSEAAEVRAETVRLQGMRKAIARNVMESLRSTAQVTSFFEIDASGPVAFRQAAAGMGRPPVSYNALFVWAAARALEANRLLNGRIVGDDVILPSSVNVGLAVALDESFGLGGGLIVPVIVDANTKSPETINEEIADKAGRARTRALNRDEVLGGTFTISSLGALPGGPFWRGTTPVISGPQSAILAICRIRDGVVVGPDGQPAVQPVLSLSLTHDHRLIDGAVAGRFIECFADELGQLGTGDIRPPAEVAGL